jgi:hypothetical protein
MRETANRRAIHQIDQSGKEHGAGVIVASHHWYLSLLMPLLSSVAQGERITHAIVFEFENLEDLAYYADTDPVSKSCPSASKESTDHQKDPPSYEGECGSEDWHGSGYHADRQFNARQYLS